jgi:transposase-like protein
MGSERPIAHIGAELGMHPETLRNRVRQAQVGRGKRPICWPRSGAGGDPPLAPGEHELRRTNDPEIGDAVFARELDPDRPK